MGRTSRWLAVFILTAGPARSLAAEEPAGASIGAAEAAFTLPTGVPLAGYSRRQGAPSTGAHDALGVRALAVRDAETTLVVVSADLLIVDERLDAAVRRRLAERGAPDTLIVIMAGTHTHSGPGAYGTKLLEKVSMGHYDPKVFDAIVEAAAQAAAAALADLGPAGAWHGAVQTQGLVENRMDAAGPVDGELGVSAFFRPGAAVPFAVVVNFAAHPTTLGAWNRALSADYPGVVRRRIQERFSGAIGLFIAGAVGDQAPKTQGEGFERAEWFGEAVADAALRLLEGARPEPVQIVRARTERVPLPPARVRLGRFTLPRWVGARLVDDDATLSAAVIGRTAWFGAPCDLSALLGDRLKQAARAVGLSPVIVGFASDYIGYCLPEALYETKEYESSMAFNGPKTGELVVDRLMQMLEIVRGTGQETGGRETEPLQ